MTARSQMKQRADLERAAAGNADAWGHAPVPAWEALAADKPCLAWSTAKREVVGTGTNAKTAVVEDIRLMVPLGTDVTEKDRVRKVKDRAGTTILDGPFGIASVQVRRTHLELALSKAGE